MSNSSAGTRQELVVLVDRIESPDQHLGVADTPMEVIGRSWVDAFQSGRGSVSMWLRLR